MPRGSPRRWIGKASAVYIGHLPSAAASASCPSPPISRPSTPPPGARRRRDCTCVNTYDLPSRAALPAHAGADPARDRRRGTRCRSRIAEENRDQPAFRPPPRTSRPMGRAGRSIARRLGEEMGIYAHALRSLRHAQLPGLARGAAGGGYRRPFDGLDASRRRRPSCATIPRFPITRSRPRWIATSAGRGRRSAYYLGEDGDPARARDEGRGGARAAKFNIRALPRYGAEALGSVPLPVLNARIDRFIAEGGPSPYPKGVAD